MTPVWEVGNEGNDYRQLKIHPSVNTTARDVYITYCSKSSSEDAPTV